MESIIVYRLENKEGVGPFQGGHREEAEQLKGHQNPIMFDSKLTKRRIKNFYSKGWVFGWDREDTFDFWMNDKIDLFNRLGYYKVSYATKQYRKYGDQVLFTFVEDYEDYRKDLAEGNQVIFNLSRSQKFMEKFK